MAVLQSGATTDQLTIEPVFKAARVSVRPLEYGALGHYAYGDATGILPAGLGANSEIFQFRWADATRFAIIRRILFSASITTTFFAAGVPVRIELIKSTGWTVAGTLGNGVTPAATLKRKTSMGSTILAAGDMRISTTAALGAGTKTFETNPLRAMLAGGPITASLNGTIFAPGTILFEANVGDGDHPLVLAQNEGFSIRVPAVPATGTWQATVSVDWAEATAY